MANASFGTYDPTDPNYGTTPQTPNLPPGQFLEDPTNQEGFDYGKFQSGWLGSAPGTSLADYIKQNPEFTKGASVSGNGETLNLPGGESFDAVRDFGPGGANAPQWGSQNFDYNTGAAYTPEQSAAAEAAWASSHPGGNGSGAAAASSATGAPVASDPYSQEVSDQISKLLSEGNAPVTSASLRDQFAPVDAQFQRGAKRAREQAAERLTQSGENNGGSGGALDTTVNSINENLAGQEGSLMSSLQGTELQARRQQVTDALTFAQGEQKNALQLQLAQIDAALKQQGLNLEGTQIGNQNTQFYDSLSARLGEDANNSNNLLNTILGL